MHATTPLCRSQTLNYLHYGEDWVDILHYAETCYPPRGIYRFNGKENDYESGVHYYGARYYWSEVLTGWLSVDLMTDEFPHISDYNYCEQNPVILCLFAKIRKINQLTN